MLKSPNTPAGSATVLQSFAFKYLGSEPGVNDNHNLSSSHDGCLSPNISLDRAMFLITTRICGSRYFYEYAVLPQHWLKNDDDGDAAAPRTRGDRLFSVYHYVRATLTPHTIASIRGRADSTRCMVVIFGSGRGR